VKELKGFFQQVPTGHWGEYFSKVLSMYPVGIQQANCFRTHNELTMYPLGKWPLAPSVRDWKARFHRLSGVSDFPAVDLLSS
jgi:hypothetical protein